MTTMITGILARMAPRPAVPGQGMMEARKVTQGPWDKCRSRHQCPYSVATGGKRVRPPVLAKSSLKQHHTRWPQGPPQAQLTPTGRQHSNPTTQKTFPRNQRLAASPLQSRTLSPSTRQSLPRRFRAEPHVGLEPTASSN